MAQRPTGPELSLETWMITCTHCRFMAPLGMWDVAGACPGNVICPKCSAEIVIETGKAAEPCGVCEFCFEEEFILGG